MERVYENSSCKTAVIFYTIGSELHSIGVSMMILMVSFLLAAQALDFDMTPQDRKKTGVSKLNEQEKLSLQEWIDNHYAKREQPLATPGKQAHPVIQDVLNNGRYIRLSDSSLWEIHPNDTPITQGWISAVEIIQTQSTDSNYPVKLTNSLTGSSVRARKASAVPQTTPPPAPPAKKTTSPK